MIRGEAWYMIRELLRAEVAVSEIARRTGVDRKTIRRIRERDRHPAPQTRPSRRSGLDPFKPYLQERADAGVLNATKLYAEIQRQGYTGGVAVVRRFVHPLRPWVVVVTERFETPPGRQGQVDWTACGQLWDADTEQFRALSAFVLTLGYSRRQYVEFTLRQDLETFLRCHVHAFHYFAGIPRELLYDNLKTAVDHRQADGSIVWNHRFRDFADYYGFLPRACQPYRAQTKGKVERGIGYLKGNFLLGLDRTNLTLGALNGQVGGWLREIADVRIHGTTRERPIDRWPTDQAALLPLDGRPDYDTSYVCQRLVSREASVAYAGARYSVPAEHAGRLVLLKEGEDGRLRIYAGQHCIATHARAQRPGPVTAPVAPPTRGPQPAPGADHLDAGAPVGAWPQVERRALSAYDTAAGLDGPGGA
jgi:transposase